EDRLLVTRATRVQPVWSDVEIAAENLDASLMDLVSLLQDLRGLLESGEQGLINQDALTAEVADLCQLGENMQTGLSKALLEEDGALICWIERSRQDGEVAVCTAPLDVAN